MKIFKLTLLFLIINFSSLYLGTLLMNGEAQGTWYTNLEKAPWTPPGWFFGVAWTIVMICFSVYLGFLFSKRSTVNKQMLFTFQVFLNVIWNYIFFNQQLIGPALIALVALAYVIFYFYVYYIKKLGKISYLLLPYLIWLAVAISLNAYILIYN